LKTLAPDEVDTAVLYLSGETPQGRLGVGFASLEPAALTPAAADASLSIIDVDAMLARLPGIKGAGAAGRRKELLRDLWSRATLAEREFLARLLLGELRQGALGGVMLDAIAAAAEQPVGAVRRAAMYAEGLGAVARAAFRGGRDALAAFQLELFSPISPMLAQTAADVGEALLELEGEAAFEWKMDGARIQVHKAADDVRIYTRGLNEVGAAVPEIVEAVRRLPAHTVVLVGAPPPVSDHHAPLRPQTERGGAARGVADRRLLFRLSAARSGEPCGSADCRARRGTRAHRPVRHANAAPGNLVRSGSLGFLRCGARGGA
jgi:DNA ligase-1